MFFSLSAFGLCLALSCLPLHIHVQDLIMYMYMHMYMYMQAWGLFVALSSDMHVVMRTSMKDHNSLGHEQCSGLDVKQSPNTLNVQDAFWPIPGLISCAGVTECVGIHVMRVQCRSLALALSSHTTYGIPYSGYFGGVKFSWFSWLRGEQRNFYPWNSTT